MSKNIILDSSVNILVSDYWNSLWAENISEEDVKAWVVDGGFADQDWWSRDPDKNARALARLATNKSALDSCEWRNHDMAGLTALEHSDGFSTECVKCGRGVVIRYSPAPNQTNVSGEAVAVNCR